MSATPSHGPALVCSFTYANGHHCRMPRKTSHLFLCTYHARKEAQAHAADQVGRDLANRFSGNYLSGSDLSAALGYLMSAVAQGTLKPRAASTLAYLSQTLPSHPLIPTRIHQRPRHRLLAQRNPRRLRTSRTCFSC